MPLPTPQKDQKKKDFIDSCMASPTMNQEYKDPKQRVAVCYSQYHQTSIANTYLYDIYYAEAKWDEIEFDNFLLLK